MTFGYLHCIKKIMAAILLGLLPFLFGLSAHAQSLITKEDRKLTHHAAHVINNWQATKGQEKWVNDPRLAHLAQQIASRFMQTGNLNYPDNWLRESLAKVSFNAGAVAVRVFANERSKESFTNNLMNTSNGRRLIGDKNFTHMGIAYIGPNFKKRRSDIQNVRIILAAQETKQLRSDWKKGLLKAVNRFRAQYGLSPLVMNNRLHQAAQYHADDMATYDYFDHISLRGKDPGFRANQMGYEYEKIYENLAAGQTTPEEVVEAWKKSKDGHREAMLVSDLTEVGFGYRFLPNDRGRIIVYHYWAMSMALPY
ncbi:CAP domain-containing protein [Curvivirga sp.]|uniref:CAP domain-containing protein n=1 Tax=Curvivirga sp. TaxID=2856848 RepID=UPI003B5CA65D